MRDDEFVKIVLDIEERYESIMSKVEIFDRHIEDKSHEDIADFYQNIFDSIQSVSESLLRAVRGLS